MGARGCDTMAEAEAVQGVAGEDDASRINMSGDTQAWVKAKNDQSELRQSVAKKGSNSYYYAHAATKDAAVVDCVSSPTLLKSEATVEEAKVSKPIEKYMFLDDGAKVKVYVELDEIGEIKDRVHCVFDFSEFDLTITDYRGDDYRLLVDDLQCPIVPEKSKIMVKPNKVVVSLHKEVRSSWYKLRKG